MKSQLNRYIWMIDMLNRYERLTRSEINELWLVSGMSDGNPMPERTFHHYRRGIEETFGIEIACDRDGRYYINHNKQGGSAEVMNWLVETYSINTAICDSSIAMDRVSVEEVPSAREFLPMVLTATGTQHKIEFTYAGFSRPHPESNIIFRPCLVKRYKQRWYMVGIREKTGDIRTYALDRVKEMRTLRDTFSPPEQDMTELFDNLIGITLSKDKVRTVRIMASPTRAKYFRALPFHRTQQELIHDHYSIFTYRLKVNYELVHELLSFGDSIKVLEPKELITMITDQLKSSLGMYDDPQAFPADSFPKPGK